MSDKVIEWAREAGLLDVVDDLALTCTIVSAIGRFATLARADMKEQCAKHFERLSGTEWFAENVADEIRSIEDQP